MLKLHDELIAELSNLLTTQNYNPVVVANHRLYARAFLDYLAECDMQVETVTPAQVDAWPFATRLGQDAVAMMSPVL